jgi:hypothetical protein
MAQHHAHELPVLAETTERAILNPCKRDGGQDPTLPADQALPWYQERSYVSEAYTSRMSSPIVSHEKRSRAHVRKDIPRS